MHLRLSVVDRLLTIKNPKMGINVPIPKILPNLFTAYATREKN